MCCEDVDAVEQGAGCLIQALFSHGRLDLMIFRGPFQPKLLYDFKRSRLHLTEDAAQEAEAAPAPSSSLCSSILVMMGWEDTSEHRLVWCILVSTAAVPRAESDRYWGRESEMITLLVPG